MRKSGIILFLVLFICLSLFGNDDVEKQTYIYSTKGTDTLRMDRYDKLSITGTKPCLIYVFGGGFKGGNRSDTHYEKFFNFLLDKGYQVISIDYRLGLKDVKDPSSFPATLPKSIYMAVEDLFDATNFILKNASEWNIDPDVLVPCGSSAGAITVLHAEYAIANEEVLSKKLPENFNYAGTISLAGAIFSHTGRLEWKNPPTPIQLFHGDADRNVPYDKLEAMNMGFYGSKHIAAQLDAIKSPYYFYKVENAEHEIAGTPIQDNLDEINTFLEQFVKNKKQLIINTKVEQIGKPEKKKDFDMMDYIKANM